LSSSMMKERSIGGRERSATAAPSLRASDGQRAAGLNRGEGQPQGGEGGEETEEGGGLVGHGHGFPVRGEGAFRVGFD
jgi:hypothetical protein